MSTLVSSWVRMWVCGSRRTVVHVLVLGLLLTVGWVSHANAQAPSTDPAAAVLPPAPSERRPVRGVEVRLLQPIPMFTRPLCPVGSACILGVGGGFGVTVERRFQNGFAIGAGYELWFATAQSVLELPTVQSLGAKLRWVLWPERAAHLSLLAGGGVVSFGDVFRVQTVGPYLEVGVGGEMEMTEALAFTIGLGVSAMTFVPFTTREDDVRRSASPYVDLVSTLHVGILWLAPRIRGH